MLVQSRLSRGRARDVWRLYAEPLASAERILRQRRLEQWRQRWKRRKGRVVQGLGGRGSIREVFPW